MLLQPAEGVPDGSGAVGETEVTEHALEVGLVKITDVPEHSLVAAVAGGHVHGVNHLLEIVVDDLDQGALLEIVLYHRVQLGEIVVAIVLAQEVVKVHQELRSGHGAHKLGTYGIDQVDELTAEAFEVGGGNGNSAELFETALQERIHGNGYAVGVAGGAALVVLVQDVALKVGYIPVGHFTAVERLDLVAHDVAVLLDVVLLVQLLSESDYIFSCDVGVGVELGTGGGVGSVDIVLDKVTLLAQIKAGVKALDVFQRSLLVDGHQRLHHLAADFLAGNFVVDVKVVGDGDYHLFGALLAGGHICLAYSAFQFFVVEFFVGSVRLSNVHCRLVFVLWLI